MGRNKTFYLIIIPVFIFLAGCAAGRIKIGHKPLEFYLAENPMPGSGITGLVIYDYEKNRYPARYNDQEFFVPASVTKLFTWYTAKKMLGDSVPSLKYCLVNDTLYFSGMGDPTFLHPDFSSQESFDFLNESSNPLAYSPALTSEPRFGPGWAWDDYPFYYSAEKSTFPLFGNSVYFKSNPGDSSLNIIPPYFRSLTGIRIDTTKNTQISRHERSNQFDAVLNLKDTVNLIIPFIWSEAAWVVLLEDTLNKKIFISKMPETCITRIIYSQPLDSIVKIVMSESDNFLAEQLLITASAIYNDTLSTALSIRWSLENLLKDEQGKMNWADGSGLSRYNLMTPEAVVLLLMKLKQETGLEHLYAMLPVPEQNGKVLSFIHAKSGSMSGVFNIAGFLETKKGKTLTFCFMYNNFKSTVKEVRSEVYQLLEKIYISN